MAYIEREAAKRHLVSDYAYAAAKMLDDIPAADVEPVRHGRWVQVYKWATKAKYRCSVCAREIMSATRVNMEKYPYCHCGAKMDAEDPTFQNDEKGGN